MDVNLTDRQRALVLEILEGAHEAMLDALSDLLDSDYEDDHEQIPALSQDTSNVAIVILKLREGGLR